MTSSRLTRTVVALAVALAAAPLAAGCKRSADTAGTGPRAADTVTLPLAQRTVGIRWTKTDETRTEVEVRQAGQQLQLGQAQRHRTDHEILEVGADGHVTRLALTYVERVTEVLGPDGGRQPSSLAGNSYIVWLEGGVVQATRADGRELSAQELAEIRADQDELGQPPVLEQIMARTWKRGERVELTAAELDRLAEGKHGALRATAMSLTLQGVTGDDAEFAMTMTMQDPEGSMKVDVTGTVVNDARTGRPRRVDLGGPVSGSAEGLEMNGTMKSVITYEFTNG